MLSTASAFTSYSDEGSVTPCGTVLKNDTKALKEPPPGNLGDRDGNPEDNYTASDISEVEIQDAISESSSASLPKEIAKTIPLDDNNTDSYDDSGCFAVKRVRVNRSRVVSYFK